MKKFIYLLAFLAPGFCIAATTPQRGIVDDHIRVVTYNPRDVVNLTTYYGVSTLVQFSDEEAITDANAGDPEAWTIKKEDSYFWIQPKERDANTNYTVVTKIGAKKRFYHFALTVAPLKEENKHNWKDSSLVYSLTFEYPETRAAQIVQGQRESKAEKIKSDIKTNLDLRNQHRDNFNFDYWAAGTELITPTSAKDDGRFIYLTFGSNKDIPSIFEVSESGEESMIKSHKQDNTVVIEKMVRRVVLRKGDSVVCVVNKSFDANDQLDNETKTVSPDVERVIIGNTE